jgi:hypothetical protein
LLFAPDLVVKLGFCSGFPPRPGITLGQTRGRNDSSASTNFGYILEGWKLYDCSEYRWVSPSFVVLGIMVTDQLEGVSFRVYDICDRIVPQKCF